MNKDWFSRALNYEMQKRDLSQNKLGRLIGKTNMTISRWIREERHPAFSELCEVIDILGNTEDEGSLFRCLRETLMDNSSLERPSKPPKDQPLFPQLDGREANKILKTFGYWMCGVGQFLRQKEPRWIPLLFGAFNINIYSERFPSIEGQSYIWDVMEKRNNMQDALRVIFSSGDLVEITDSTLKLKALCDVYGRHPYNKDVKMKNHIWEANLFSFENNETESYLGLSIGKNTWISVNPETGEEDQYNWAIMLAQEFPYEENLEKAALLAYKKSNECFEHMANFIRKSQIHKDHLKLITEKFAEHNINTEKFLLTLENLTLENRNNRFNLVPPPIYKISILAPECLYYFITINIEKDLREKNRISLGKFRILKTNPNKFNQREIMGGSYEIYGEDNLDLLPRTIWNNIEVKTKDNKEEILININDIVEKNANKILNLTIDKKINDNEYIGYIKTNKNEYANEIILIRNCNIEKEYELDEIFELADILSLKMLESLEENFKNGSNFKTIIDSIKYYYNTNGLNETIRKWNIILDNSFNSIKNYLNRKNKMGIIK